jgi:hypothetical protein
MIVTNTTPPSATVAQVSPGNAFLTGQGFPWAGLPAMMDNGGNIVRLDTGQRVDASAVQPTWAVTLAPNATTALFPSS